MDQQMQYMMWLRNKQILKPHFKPSSSINSFLSHSKNSSWEEEAFAEDVANPLTWPPRSYSCAFCRREFKSAQALGGHMNVHRRDRALLKQSQQSPSPPPPTSPESGDDSGSPPYSSLSSLLSPQISSTTLPIPKNPISPQGSDSSHSGKFLINLSNQDLAPGMYINNEQDVMVDTKLSVGLNMIYESCDNYEESYNISSKRQRLINNDVNSLSFTSKRCDFQTKDVRRKVITSDNIDLELRLG